MSTVYLETDVLPLASTYNMNDIVVLLKSDDRNVAYQKCGDTLWKAVQVPSDSILKDHQSEHNSLGVAPAVSGLINTVIIGDSMSASHSGNSTITSISRTNNIAIVSLTSHGKVTGETVRIYNCLDNSYNTNEVIITKLTNDTFSYPSIGEDGNSTAMGGSKLMQLQSPLVCNDNAYLFWLNTKTGGAFKLLRNAACNGQNSSDMLARFDQDVLSKPNADLIIIFTGYNDFVNAAYTADQVYSNVTQMVNKSAGKLVVVVSSIPWINGGTATNRAEAMKYNRMIRQFCNSKKNVRFADAAKYIIDPMNATKFSPLTGMLVADGIHPSPKGGDKIAQAIYDAIQYEIPKQSRLVSCSLDNYGSDVTNKNIVDNAPWTNTGGALAGGATGVAALGFGVTNAGSGTTVASVVSRTDGIGYDQQVVFTPAANNDSVTLSSTGYISGRCVPGDKLNLLAELTLSGMSGANIKSIDCYVSFNGASSTPHTICSPQAPNASSYPNTDTTLTLSSLIDATVLPNTTGIGWGIVIKAGAAGTALTAKLGRLSIEKV